MYDDITAVHYTDKLKKEILGKPFSEEEGIAVLKKYCKDNNITYYGRPSKDFFISEACIITRTGGNSKVILDDLGVKNV